MTGTSGGGSAIASVSVVICAYTLDRWADLAAAVDSVRAQRPAPTELLVVIDHNPELAEKAARAWNDVRVLVSGGPPGLSGARNSGVAAASGDLVAFLDDDATAEPGWLAALIEPYADARVVATGGWASPKWDGAPPRWFPPEFLWVVGCSHRGLPTEPAPVRNPIGCSMAFRRAAILEAGGFRPEIGRIGLHPVGGEETELCIRIGSRHPDSVVILSPAARVRHRVPASRATWRYFRSRCYQEGRSKALISRLAGAGPALATERRYTLRVLPGGFLRGLGDLLHGDPSGPLRSFAIAAGLTVTTGGFVAARIGIDPLPVPPR